MTIDKGTIQNLVGIIGALTLRVSRTERRLRSIEGQIMKVNPDGDIAQELFRIKKTLYNGNGRDPLVEVVDRLLVDTAYVSKWKDRIEKIKRVGTFLALSAAGALVWYITRLLG